VRGGDREGAKSDDEARPELEREARHLGSERLPSQIWLRSDQDGHA